MKNIIAISAFLLSTCAFAQVAIGKTTLTNNPSVSLTFGDYVTGPGKGLIVPYVSSAANVTGAQMGTIVFDTNDNIMKYKKADGTWFNLSKNETINVDGQINVNTTGKAKMAVQTGKIDAPTAKVSIGAPTTTPGILVLEDNNKAMVLPKVPNPHLNIVNPEAGTMVYDTVSKQLAVFNGTVWSYWKP